MNWHKLKEKFPNCYPEIRELYKETRMDGEFLLREYLTRHGRESDHFIIPRLREIEAEKKKG